MEVDPLVYVTVETHVVEGDSHVSEPTRSAVGPTGLIRRSESEARESESRNGVGGGGVAKRESQGAIDPVSAIHICWALHVVCVEPTRFSVFG